jgi:hypothetical protein
MQCRILLKRIPHLAKPILLVPILISVFGGLAFYSYLRAQAGKPQEFSGFMRAGFLERALDEAHVANLGPFIDAGNGMMVTLYFAGIFAVCSTLVDVRQAATSERDHITSSIRSLRTLLNASALALVVGVIQVNFEYRWASTLLVAPPPDQDKLWEPGSSAAASIILSTGGLLSFVLAATFIPAGTVLYTWVCKYNEGARAAAVGSRSFRLKRAAAAGSRIIRLEWKQMLGDVFKIIGPVLTAGPLAAILSK